VAHDRRSRAIAAALGTVAACGAIPLATAQGHPLKPVRLVVSVQPGGNLDLIGRAVADKAAEGLGQRVFVENRPGANSTIGLAHVARSAPDG
jgi:tripartite-type tricarboxylate transporter receptor subunit TctC